MLAWNFICRLESVHDMYSSLSAGSRRPIRNGSYLPSPHQLTSKLFLARIFITAISDFVEFIPPSWQKSVSLVI